MEIAWLSLDNMTIPSIIRSITFIHSKINAKFLRQPIQQWEGFIGILYVLLKLNVTLVYSHRIVFTTTNGQTIKILNSWKVHCGCYAIDALPNIVHRRTICFKPESGDF